MIYCPSCGHVAHTRRAHFMDDGTKIMIAQCRNIYCSATFEASESFFSDCKDEPPRESWRLNFLRKR